MRWARRRRARPTGGAYREGETERKKRKKIREKREREKRERGRRERESVCVWREGERG